MDANKEKIGKRIRNKETKDILEVQQVNGAKMWVDLKWGDTYSWVDESLYDDLDYYL